MNLPAWIRSGGFFRAILTKHGNFISFQQNYINLVSKFARNKFVGIKIKIYVCSRNDSVQEFITFDEIFS